MKTWICTIFGGGAPTYLVSANDEKSAWQLIKNASGIYLSKDTCGGLIEVPDWHAEEERIDNINELFAPNGVIKRGTFNGL